METHALDLQVAFDKFQFLLERNLVGLGAVEGAAQQIAQTDKHVSGRPCVFVNQYRNRVEGIEEKMRMQLFSQGVELCLGQLRFQLRGSDFTLLILAIGIERVSDGDDRSVDE